MGRHSEINFWASKGGYYTQYKGERYPLHKCEKCDKKTNGPNFRAALKEFDRIVASLAAQTAWNDERVSSCIERWTTHLAERNQKNANVTAALLQPIGDKFGHWRADQLTPRAVIDCIDGVASWSNSTKATVHRKVKSCFAWNKKDLAIPADPLADMWTPEGWHSPSRCQRHVLPSPLLSLLLAESKGRFRDLLFALSETGARPSELYQAIRRNYVPKIHAVVHLGDEKEGFIWKNARKIKKGDKDRRIYLSAELEDIVARNARRGNVLFPNRSNGVYTINNARVALKTLLNKKAIAEWLGDNDHNAKYVVPYSFRHTWITRAIQNAVPIKDVADLTGTSVTMIEKHYCHSGSDPDYMFRRFTQARGTPVAT